MSSLITSSTTDTPGMSAEPAYTTMRDAIAKAGRPMVFSISQGPATGTIWTCSKWAAA
jgi:hypothetical protein